VLRLYLAGASAADRADLRLVGVVRVGLRGGRVRMRVWVWVRVRALPAVVRDGTGQCCFKLHELIEGQPWAPQLGFGGEPHE